MATNLSTGLLEAGDPAPHFAQRTMTTPKFTFDSMGGRYLVLLFFGSSSEPLATKALKSVFDRADLFDGETTSFFGVTFDAADEKRAVLQAVRRGINFFLDFDLRVSRLYKSVTATQDSKHAIERFWLILDPTFRVLARYPLDGTQPETVLDFVASLPPPGAFAGFEVHAPVIVLPRVFETELCADLIGRYQFNGGKASGVMREINGKTVGVHDPSFKKRKDHVITDKEMIATIQERFVRRVRPELRKVHSFNATRMERYIVSCYAAEDGGHFMAHRDNTTAGTAHRRFAISINLNEDFDGGELRFPEYGAKTYKAPPGGAIVFSGSLLHAVTPVTRGERYAFLPFVYDEEAAKIRQANAGTVVNAQMP